MSRSTSPARPDAPHGRRLRLSPRLLGRLTLGAGALLVPVVTAAPAFADTTPGAASHTSHTASQVAGDGTTSTKPTSSATAASDSKPTPAPQAPDYGAKPETDLLGVPVEGTLSSIQRAGSILPGSGPGDYA